MKTIEQAYNEWFKEQFGRLSEYDELTQEEVDLCAKKWDELSDEFEVLEDLSFSFNENVTILDIAYGMLCNLVEGGYLNKK